MAGQKTRLFLRADKFAMASGKRRVICQMFLRFVEKKSIKLACQCIEIFFKLSTLKNSLGLFGPPHIYNTHHLSNNTHCAKSSILITDNRCIKCLC